MKKFLALALLLLSTPAFAQSWAKGTCASVVRISAASSGSISQTASAGNLLIFLVVKQAASGADTMTGGYPQDTNGALSAAFAYTEVTANGNRSGHGAYYILSAASGTHTLSVSFSGNSSWDLYACVYSYTGTAVLDQVSASINTGTGTSWNSGSLTPTQSGDLVIASGANTSTAAFSSFTNGFVQEQSNRPSSFSSTWADLNPYTCSGSCAAISAGATLASSQNWAGIILSFAQASGAGSVLLSGGSVVLIGGKPVVIN